MDTSEDRARMPHTTRPSTGLCLLVALWPAIASAMRPAAVHLRSTLQGAESVLVETRTSGQSRILKSGEKVTGSIVLRGGGEASRAGRELAEGEMVIPGFFARGQTLEESRIGVLRRGSLPMPGGGFLPTEGYVMGARQEGSDLVVPVLLPGPGESATQEYLLVDHSASEEWSQPAILEPDPLDPEPRGDRQPVILIHGKDDPDPGSAYKTAIWKALREDPTYPSLFESYKFYIYRYPTYHSARESGRVLRQTIDQVIGLDELADRSVVLVAHSQGGLVSRWAMNTEGFGDKVKVLITGTTPHHGSGAGSLLFANGRISDKVGWFWAALLRFGQSGEPDNPGLRSLGWDNYDGAISPADREKYGLHVNEELAWLNTHDAYTDRLVCLMGDVRGLVGHGPYALVYEMIRRGLSSYHGPWASSDPVVSMASGTFAGGTPQDALVFPGRDHDQLLRDPEVADHIRSILGFRALAGDPLIDFP